jgi:hypothetical protein
LELPLWMFDRAECTVMGIATIPRVNPAALSALAALLTEVRGNRGAERLTSPNRPDSGAGWRSHDENRGDVCEIASKPDPGGNGTKLLNI